MSSPTLTEWRSHPVARGLSTERNKGQPVSTLNDLAKRLHAFESKDNAGFQRRARILQSLWREEMGYPMGELPSRKLGSRVPMPWSQETQVNFLDDTIRQVVREEVLDPERAKGKLCETERLFGNLLSSQPLAFNLFAHLGRDLSLATQVLRAMTNGRCQEATGIEFEYSPGRGDIRYTGGRSAFDVYFTFTTPEGQPGFVGIEVKYHEDLSDRPSKHRPRYDEVAQAMGCFRSDSLPRLRKKPIQQMWCDHLLAGSMQLADGFDDGIFAFLSPQGNEACNKAVDAYRECLTNDSSFQHWTLEHVVEVVGQFTDAPWVDALYSRYLDFSKIQEHLA